MATSPTPPSTCPLRSAISARLAEFDQTRNWLARRSGVDSSSLYKFLDGEAGLRLAGVLDILRVLGLDIVARPNFVPDNPDDGTKGASH